MNSCLVALLSALLVIVRGQRLGNQCGKAETNRFLAMVDCISYVRCFDGQPVLKRCPPLVYFNPVSKDCDLRSQQECTEASHPSRLRLLTEAHRINHILPDKENIQAFHIGNEVMDHGQVDPPTSGKGLMVCYYTNWAQYRPGFAKFTPKDIDATLCNHLHYAFAKFNYNHTIAAYEWNDESTPWMKGMFEKFNDLKNANPGLKTTLSLGGWNLASQPFTAMVTTRETRNVFIDSAIAFLRRWNFDGLGLDWEYPGNRGSPAGDKEKFTLLVQETMAAFKSESEKTNRGRLLLSAAVSAGKDTIDSAYEVQKISSVLDYLVVMTYDFFGAWNDYTGLVSPLYPPKDATGIDAIFNVDYAVKYWVSKGCPRNKLVVGVISYGRAFTLTSTSNTGLKAPTNGPGTPGQYTREAGFLSYYEVCRMIQRGAKIVRLEEEKVPYLVLNNQWVTYEDKESITTKADYIRNGGYAGAALWAIPLDDFKGSQCGEGPYPILSTVAHTLKYGRRNDKEIH